MRIIRDHSIDRLRCEPPTGEVLPMTTEQSTSKAGATAAPSAVRMVIGGEDVDAADGQTFEVVNPATGKVIAKVPLGGREDVDRAVAAAQKAFDDRKGWATWAAGKRGRTPGEVRRPRQAEQRGAVPARDGERRQADHIVARRGHRREPRLRLLRRGGQQDLRPDDSRVQAGHRHDPPRADRRRRAHRAVELPDPHGLLEARPRAGGRQCLHPQARELLAADRDPPRRAGARGRHPRRDPQRRDRARRHRRRLDRGPSRDRQGRVHRRDDDRPGDHAARLGQREEDLARARRQEPEHRLRRRRPRAVREGIALQRLRQLRPGLLRPEPDPRRAFRPRRGRGALRRSDPERQGRRPARRRDGGRDPRQHQAARAGQGLHRDRPWRGRDTRRRGRGARTTRRWPAAPT